MNAQEIKKKYFNPLDHPYYKYEKKIESIISESSILLDAGCGRNAPFLKKFKNKAKRLIGVDIEEPGEDVGGIEYFKCNLSDLDIQSSSIDIVVSRAVLEHVKDPAPVFGEINRVLRPGGNFIFLVPNLYDYVSMTSKAIPNNFQKMIVSKAEGREIEDVFPTYYKTNTYNAIKRLSINNNFSIESFDWLGQYPSHLMFNPYLFMIGTIYEKIISRFELLKFLRGWLLVHLRKLEY